MAKKEDSLDLASVDPVVSDRIKQAKKDGKQPDQLLWMASFYLGQSLSEATLEALLAFNPEPLPN